MAQIHRVKKSKVQKHGVYLFDELVDGERFSGLVVSKDGKYFAFENLCAHLAVSLGSGKEILSKDKESLVCTVHGARYHKDSGYCFEGPCQGDSLRALDLKEDGDRVVIDCLNSTVLS